MKPNSQTNKQKLLAKYIDPPKKKSTKSFESNVFLRDQQVINDIQSSSSSEEESEKNKRIYSSDEEMQHPKKQKKEKKQKKNKTQKKIRKMIRKKLKLSKDQDVDDFIKNIQIQGVSIDQIGNYLKDNKDIKFEHDEIEKKKQKKEKTKNDKYKMFQNEQSSDLQIPQQARTVYRNKDGIITGHSQKMAKQKHKQQVEQRLAEWEKGMKKAQSSSDQNDEQYRLAKHRKVFDDPMKRWENQNLVKPLKCKFDGPPNRFNIKPGFRWDGVIRGNGFENRYLQEQNLKKVEQDRIDREYLKNL